MKNIWIKISDSFWELKGSSAFVVKDGDCFRGYTFTACIADRPELARKFMGKGAFAKAKSMAGKLTQK